MWRPPEKIRHATAPGTWPSADEAARSQLFSPLRYGALDLTHRTWVPAMVPWRASEDGFVTDAVVEWYERFAQGRPGAIVVEATGIRDVPSGPLLRIGDDRFLPGLTRLAEAVRKASGGQTRLFVQLIDFLTIRRRVDQETYLRRFLQVGARHREALGMAGAREEAVRETLLALGDHELREVLDERELEALRMGYRERVTDTHLPHVAALPAVLPGLFAAAAARAQAAGFDGVELHYAHAYTMASFLSAGNTRADGYGGPLENRLRLPLEVYAAVRARVGGPFAVGCRFLAEECITGGNGPLEAEQIGVAFARAGLDFLSLSRGGKFEDALAPKVGAAAYPYTGPSGYECMPSYISDVRGPFGRNAAPARDVRAAIRAAGHDTPVVLAGGFHGFRQAEAALAARQADVIGMARQALADPDWWRKVLAGRGEAVRLCEFTNYCEALDQKHTPVTCQLWDRTPRPEGRKTPDGKRWLTAPPWTGDED
jgi:2,4-dienoyl-CoA reductase-like NADH-dependent reductase (Old Yellow Enzyme family)